MNLPRNQTIGHADYAARQADLLDALMRGDGYPPGFDPTTADAAGRALRRKRARAVRHAWPALTSGLGGDFERRIDAFLRVHPTAGDGLADGLAFARWIGRGQAADGEQQSRSHRDPTMTDDVRVEIVLARAAISRLFVGLRYLRDPARVIVVLNAPWVGLRVCCLPVRRS